MKNTTIKSCKTYWVKIFMAGDYNVAAQTCRKYCLEKGLCVTLDRTKYIYTGGEEEGFIVGLINYPRFPKEPVEISRIAYDLAETLLKDCYQHSFTLMTPDGTEWFTLREQK